MEGFRAVPHDLLDLKDAGTLYVAGDARAKHVVFFCAGFPDDHSAFAPLAARLAASRGCLVGLSCIAEYEREAPLRPQGYDLDEMTGPDRSQKAELALAKLHNDTHITQGYRDGFVQ